MLNEWMDKWEDEWGKVKMLVTKNLSEIKKISLNKLIKL